MSKDFNIAVLPGDGIGKDVVDASLEVMQAVAKRVPDAQLNYQWHDAGATHYQSSGDALPAATLKACENADAIFLGAMGLPDVRYDNGTEISPQLDIRDHFELYAGVRPIKSYKGLPQVLTDPRASDIDMVLVREQTEGLFYDRGKKRIENGVAFDTMAISDKGARRISQYGFRIANRRGPRANEDKARVTLIDKANVLGSMVFFREVFMDVARSHEAVHADAAYVDATALNLIRKPWSFDVMVTENQFGDILSDLCAALIGGMGMAPSGDIGDKHAMFQPAHGSAPDIAGKGIANPTATVLSVAMMLEWLAEQHNNAPLTSAARLLEKAVAQAFAPGKLLPAEFGGKATTADITRAIAAQVANLPIPGAG